MNRRAFIKNSLAVTGTLFLPVDLFGGSGETRLTILHTNDTHSRIDPFPESDPRYAGLGGVARRKTLIESIRKEEEHVLLLDAGDIFQGTPYFNVFGGEVEFRSMSEMGYDAATIGNHDFDNGLDGLNRMLPYAQFPFLSSNYDFSETILAGKIKSYQVFAKGKIRIGIFGLGVQLKGLVDPNNYGNTVYNDPVPVANTVAKHLREKENCDLIICLSHLGYQYNSEQVSDLKLAKSSHNIDLILGGHTHTFLDKPVAVQNAEGKEVLISQVGWSGIKLGKLTYVFDKQKRKKISVATALTISPSLVKC